MDFAHFFSREVHRIHIEHLHRSRVVPAWATRRMKGQTMPNQSNSNEDKSRNSGHGALGMGGQPIEDPRDLEGGGEGRTNDDRGGGTGPIPGAFGGGTGVGAGGGTAGNETVGPAGDRDITESIDRAVEASRRRDEDKGGS